MTDGLGEVYEDPDGGGMSLDYDSMLVYSYAKHTLRLLLIILNFFCTGVEWWWKM